MLSDASTSVSPKLPKSPADQVKAELADAAGDVAPSYFMGRLVGIHNMLNMLSAARRRVNDSHRRQEAVLDEVTGKKTSRSDSSLAEGDYDMESGISVQGDTSNVTHHHHASRGGVLPWIVSAALAGALGPLAYEHWFSNSDNNAAPNIPNWALDLEVKDEP